MNKTLAFFKEQIGKELIHSPSPVGIWLKPVLKDIEEGTLKAEFIVRKEMTNPAGTLHGGIITLIADEMIGATIATLELPTLYVSVNLYTDFLNIAKLGETVTAETKIIRKGKNIINTECMLYNSKGILIAKSYSNNIKINNVK